ncbi:MAG: translation initiation factor IF-2 N-terminal domain-containing protein, partial [Sporosarcina sp.]
MTKIRVHEYAKKVNRSSKEVIDELGKLNVNVANHMSTIDKEAITKLDSKFTGNVTKQNASKADPKPAGQTASSKPAQRPQSGN